MENQKALVKEYIEKQSDMEFFGLYCDNGQIGTHFANPAFEQLMQGIKERKIDFHIRNFG